MLLPVLIISSLVHIYSISYMQLDPQVPSRTFGVYILILILASVLNFLLTLFYVDNFYFICILCFINLSITIISLLTLRSIQPVYTNTGVYNFCLPAKQAAGLTSLERPFPRYEAKRGFTIRTSLCVGFNQKRYYSDFSKENENFYE